MKIKKISIIDWFCKRNYNLNINLEEGLNVIYGPNVCGKTMLVQDVLSLVKPVSYKSDSIEELDWSGSITDNYLEVDLFGGGKVVWSSGFSQYYPKSYKFTGYNPNEISPTSIVQWLVDDALEIWSLDDIYENLIDASLLAVDKEDYERLMEGLNYVLDFPIIKSFSSILVNGEERFRAVFSDDSKKWMDKMSFGWKCLMSIILLTPLEKNSLYYLDCPEAGLSPSWCSRLGEALRRINPNMQVIIISHSKDIVNSIPNKIFLPDNIKSQKNYI